MTLKEALSSARLTLTEGGIPDAALESELLLRHLLGLDRTSLFLKLENSLTPQQADAYTKLVKRRLNGEPSAYITGHREFYGLEFSVNHNVLIPRPETEHLVEKAINLAKSYAQPVIADIGTGSGAIAISLALNLPSATIYAIDASADALKVTKANCQRHDVSQKIKLLQGDLLSPLPKAVDIIAANLPYVPQQEAAQNRYEPQKALDGGADGTDEIKRLCQQADRHLKDGGSLLLEIGQGQEKIITNFLKDLYPQAQVEVQSDLAGILRLITATFKRI